MKTLIALLVLIPVIASADSEQWLKYQLNPEQLYVVATSGEKCPLSTKEVEKETQNILVRSRIKPLQGGGLFGYPYLSIQINCLNVPESSNVFAVMRIDFIDIVTLRASSTALKPDLAKTFPGWDMIIKARLGEQLHDGSILIADKRSLKAALKESIEGFTADYLKANFDLGEDE